MKSKIGIILLMIFLILISVSGIVFAIPILDKEGMYLEQWLNALLMLICGVITLPISLLLLLIVLRKKE